MKLLMLSKKHVLGNVTSTVQTYAVLHFFSCALCSAANARQTVAVAGALFGGTRESAVCNELTMETVGEPE
jgi:hypothetical protein